MNNKVSFERKETAMNKNIDFIVFNSTFKNKVAMPKTKNELMTMLFEFWNIGRKNQRYETKQRMEILTRELIGGD